MNSEDKPFTAEELEPVEQGLSEIKDLRERSMKRVMAYQMLIRAEADLAQQRFLQARVEHQKLFQEPLAYVDVNTPELKQAINQKLIDQEVKVEQ